jgi:uncharacterized membrane protein YeaQ/YmgE (transglycosylase-associated protein family)
VLCDRVVALPSWQSRDVDHRDGFQPTPKEGDNPMGIIAWIILGLVAGLIARALLPGRDSEGLIATLLIGIAGAVVGGLIAEALGFGGLGSFFELRTWIIAVAGSALLLVLVRVAKGGRSPRGGVIPREPGWRS